MAAAQPDPRELAPSNRAAFGRGVAALGQRIADAGHLADEERAAILRLLDRVAADLPPTH